MEKDIIKGKTLEETFNCVEENKHKIQHFIIADSLMCLRRGGRVGSAKAIVGTMLNIKPVLTFTKEGKLEKYKQASGMKTAIKNVVDEYANYTVNKEYPIAVTTEAATIGEMIFLQYFAKRPSVPSKIPPQITAPITAG